MVPLWSAQPGRWFDTTMEVNMYKKLEALGSGMLGLFVPKVEASAEVRALACHCWNACWQCAGSSCCVNTSNGCLTCGRSQGCRC
jgi:hypothetical protein